MKRKFSIYHFLVALMLSTLLLPAFAGAEAQYDDGSLTIHKYEREPGAEEGEDGDGSEEQTVPGDATKLEGVTFTITQTHAYDAVNDKWTEISNGAKHTESTDANGVAYFGNLAYGRYAVEETAGPPHVNLNPETYHVDIPMTSKDGNTVNYDVHIYPKNETIRGAVELHKVDGATCPEEPPTAPSSTPNGNEVEECKSLEGVIFDLYSDDGTLISAGHKTNASGKIQVNGLKYGTYYFKEVKSAEGYLSGGKVYFDIVASGQIDENGERDGAVVEVTARNFSKPGVEKEVNKDAVNRGEIVKYTITVDLPADINEYSNFTIIDELDPNLEYVNGSEVSPDGFTFSKNGQTLTWEKAGDLEPGEAKVTFEAKVSENAEANKVINNEARIVYHNGYDVGGDKTPKVPVTPTAGLLKVLKQDGDTEEGLAGAEFELRDSEGNKVSSGTTGANGILDFGELDYGNYTLHEMKAPEGYNKLRNPIDVTIGDGELQEQTIVVDNFESGWELPKTGGIGTMLFTFIGLSLMGTASFMYARRRKGETV